MDGGMEPMKELEETSRRKTLVSLPSVEGKGPVNLLDEISRTRRVGPKLPTRGDKGPLRRLFSRKISVTLVSP
jgi:hypothetical protein